MTLLMMIHVTGGTLALVAGTIAVTARKGGPLHARSGTWFLAAMLALGVTAAFLEPMREPTPGSPVGGIMVCYFVLTSWAAARGDGTSGRIEIAACVSALAMAALMIWGGLTGAATPAGTGPIFALAMVMLIAGLLDLNAVIRRKLTGRQRIARHLWRMCFAFFVATGSFFLGQQDVLPAAVRGSPWLFLPAFAPFGVMAFWLVRLRFAKALNRLLARLSTPSTAMET